MEEYIVYVRTDESGVIIAINSSAFVDGEGWTEIDRGSGDRCHHAQGNYLPDVIADEVGVYNYKLVNGRVVERTETEKTADRAALADAERNRPATATEIGVAILNALES